MENYQPQPNRQPEQSSIWTTWNSARIVALIIALQIAGFILQGIIFQMGLPMFPAVGIGTFLGILVPVFLLARQPGLSLARDFGLVPVSLKVMVLSAAMAAASLMPMSLLGSMSIRLHAPDPHWIQTMVENLPANNTELLMALITVSIIAPLAEEIVFRGLLFRLVRRTWGIPHAFVISALVFAIIHFQPWFLLGLVGVGLLLAFVYQATGSALAAAVCHMVYNAISLIQMTHQGDQIAVDAPLGTNLLLGAGVSLGVMILIGKVMLQSPRHST